MYSKKSELGVILLSRLVFLQLEFDCNNWKRLNVLALLVPVKTNSEAPHVVRFAVVSVQYSKRDCWL